MSEPIERQNLDQIAISRAPHSGWRIRGMSTDGIAGRTLACFTNSSDMLAWLTAQLIAPKRDTVPNASENPND